MGAVLAKILNAGGVGKAINEMISMLVSSAEGSNIPGTVVLVAGLILSVFIGIFGYKYIKLLSVAIFGVIGYGIGSEFFFMAINQFGWELPPLVAYLFGIAMFVLFVCLVYKKFAYALFVVAGMVGFFVGYFIYPNYFLAFAVAIVVALLAISFVRYCFVILLSVCAGFILVGMVSALVPDFRLLSLTEGFVGTLIAVVVSLIFVAIQLRMSHVEIKKMSGPRRVKIRRVFDTW